MLERCRKVVVCAGKVGRVTHKVGGGGRERVLLFQGYTRTQQSSHCPAPPVAPAPVKDFFHLLTEKERLPATGERH